MKVELINVGKRFNREWIFRKINVTFEADGRYAITGPNGSGKSTLLQIVAGALTHNEGEVHYSHADQLIEEKKVFRRVSVCAPYLELIEEMTLSEFFSFHKTMKGFMNSLSVTNVIEILELQRAANRQIRYFSSGMKQRVKLAQAILSPTTLVLLDEPLTNLDKAGIDLYHHLITNFCSQKTVLVSSNDPQEYAFCDRVLDIKVYK